MRVRPFGNEAERWYASVVSRAPATPNDKMYVMAFPQPTEYKSGWLVFPSEGSTWTQRLRVGEKYCPGSTGGRLSADESVPISETERASAADRD